MGKVSKANVDVTTSIVIDRPRGRGRRVRRGSESHHIVVPQHHGGGVAHPGAVEAGSQVTFTAKFLGRQLTYTYEVRELVTGERFVMSTAEGPFPMETTYSFQDDAADGATRMTLRNRGEPAGFAKVAAPIMAGAMRRANRKDLEQLKRLNSRPQRADMCGGSRTFECRS